MAIKKVYYLGFTCDSCGIKYPIKFLIQSDYGPCVCEGCFNDGVLDDININGDMASVNTSEVY